MATVYSLLCFGGRTGKTATMTIANPCVVTLTNHGLRDGFGVVFSTSGALPTGVTSGATYYAKSTAANTFNLYDTSANAIAGGTTGRVTATGSQSGTHTIKSAYRNGLTTDQLLRYGTAGSERIYDSLRNFALSRAVALPLDQEICEISDAFTDITSTSTSMNIPAAFVKVTSSINGVRSAAFHSGVIGQGYILSCSDSQSYWSGGYPQIIDGFSIYNSSTGNAIGLVHPLCEAHQMICKGTGSGRGIRLGASTSRAVSCISTGFANGVYISQYATGTVLANCLLTGNTVGVKPESTSQISGRFYNNISIGNTTNWDPQPTGLEFCTHNAGLSTDTPWATSTNPKITLATTDFFNFAGDNFRPALSTSPQVDVSFEYYNIPPLDIADSVRPSYINGTTDKFDCGPYEFDHGNGAKPNSVTVAGSGVVTASRIKIAKQSDGSELRNVVLGGTSDSYSQNAASDIPVYIYLRKGSAAPYYKPVRLSATITAAGGLTYDVTGLQIPDIAASTYAAGVATDWTLNTTTGAIVHASGSTRYSVQDLYSYHQNFTDDNATVDDMLLMDGTTPTVFSLVNSGAITDADHQFLYGGSISEASGATLWSNIYSVGGLAGSPTIYIYQGSTKLTNYWAAGHVDLLLKVKASGSLISSGLVTGFSRKWGYTYDHYEVDLSGGGRNVMPLATLADANNQTARATVAAYSGITATFGTYSRDFGDGAGSKTYYCEIDCNNLPLAQIYEYTKYLTDESNATTLNGVPGNRYLSAHASIAAVKSAPFGVFAGGTWSCAQGVWLINVPSGDTYNYIVTDTAAGAHQNVQALFQSATVSNVAVGSRVQIYDTTSSTELYNGIAATSSVTWNDGSAPAGDRAIRVRIQYVNSATAKNFLEANIGTCGTSAETKDVAYLANQTNDTTYIANGKDGATVTGIAIVEGAVDRVQIAIAGGSVPWSDIYAYQCYWLFTAAGIQDDGAFISAPDTANYILTGFKIKNTHATVPLIITSGYGVDSTGSVSALYDTTGTSIFPAPAHVVPFQTSGSYAITGDIATIMTGLNAVPAAVLSAATATPIAANIEKVNGQTINGAGTVESPWGA